MQSVDQHRERRELGQRAFQNRNALGGISAYLEHSNARTSNIFVYIFYIFIYVFAYRTERCVDDVKTLLSE